MCTPKSDLYFNFKVHSQLLYITQIILCQIMPKILVTHLLKFEKQSFSKDYVLKRPKQITPTTSWYEINLGLLVVTTSTHYAVHLHAD